MRVFVALNVPEDVKSQLAVQQFMLPIPRKTARDQFHITLAFMGDLHDQALEALDEGLTDLRMDAFDLSLAGFGLFGKARPNSVWAAVAPSEPLARLQAKVARAGRLAGAEIPARKFTPHITLGRFAPMGIEEAAPLERAVIAGAGFRAGPWAVDEMILFRSTLTADGPRYDVLAQYPLTQ
ncbi:RNA 2',3'-cyclic phosphodiesterase [Pseudorhodobacter aquimaris]|uniref:RNA 2',3'-cyclic phosphodiesterase n=1 Tax=Pseudorhodobacter aquimaris TaxID=687412 RepID=UPI00067DCA73|nr:RNA 2',3'-cyclic phosphodiesterase [Pseudorhodobacter aquimaris]